MTEPSLLSLLATAFGLGLLHALDADHLAALGSLMSDKSGYNRSLKYCTHWSLGHGSVILLTGTSVFMLGLSIPHSMSHLAEILVAALLLGLGFWTLYDVLYHQHKHRNKSNSVKHRHGALFIGCIHGLAGSATLLAIIPLSHSASPWQALAYLATFVVTVLLGMLCFGSVFSRAWQRLSAQSAIRLSTLRLLIALCCVVVGLDLLSADLGSDNVDPANAELMNAELLHGAT
ncbi:MAG: hypothetical protein OEZ68_03070 [Gammaproteobacteria bacterium]|nr:hypothetical protein [Gammaproteobacteria bacterium]MDH5799764.1 hypothetical protein [Gammaproteobacteria bacterium]